MAKTQVQTKVALSPNAEVGVRTMRSDISSISKGNSSPEPEIVAPPIIKTKKAKSQESPRRKSKLLRWMIRLVILALIVWVIYKYVWPKINALIQPGVLF